MSRLLEYIQNHPLLAGLAFVLAIAVLVYELRQRGRNYSALQPQEAIRLMNQGAAVYDLRPAEAYAAGHIGNAKPLTADQLANAPEVLKKHREKLLILYCETGTAATAAVRRLHEAGFTKVFALRGGVAAWRAENLPLVRT
jgi:rhodanese-related sulfurtransferase